ncbi:MAG TPA: hypothetical protein ENI76_02810 [Ignavibacteria bacterium]|nr:hypothetical protein [Ignavibacteria bacterium]
MTIIGGGDGGASPLTTKGDVAGYDTVDARIPVGADGQVLTADAVQALGVKWATPSGGGVSPSFSVHMNGVNQTGIVTGTWTKLLWSTELFDTNNDFATSRFTPTVAGKYWLHSKVLFNTGLVTNKTLKLTIWKNGVVEGRNQFIVINTSYNSISVVKLVEANGTTDYFEIFAWHDTGLNEEIYGPPAYSWFEGNKID